MMNLNSYLQFFNIILLINIVPVIIIFLIVLLSGKIFKKDNFKDNLISISPFILVLMIIYFIVATFWDLFIERKDHTALFSYWDQLPWGGFSMLSHERPVTNNMDKNLAPGITLVTIDLIWVGMLIVMYSLTLIICWFLFWRKKPKRLIYALIISGILLLLGILWGTNRRGLVI